MRDFHDTIASNWGCPIPLTDGTPEGARDVRAVDSRDEHTCCKETKVYSHRQKVKKYVGKIERLVYKIQQTMQEEEGHY